LRKWEATSRISLVGRLSSADLEAFAANLRAARDRRGLTQEQLSHVSGVTSGEVSKMERGAREPKITTLVKLADALDVPPADLLAGLSRRDAAR
jgi:transcriptional regulator with XRE-family HTH domain